jgi:uncharacterized cupredoxin-like copper-binding protein
LLSVTCALALTAVAFVFEVAPAAVAKPTAVKVTLSDNKIVLSRTSAPLGKVTFSVTNKGKKPHNFKVCTKKSATNKANTCAGEATAVLKPGKSATLTVTLVLGNHTYLSSVAKDAKAGMKGGFKIVKKAVRTPETVKVILGALGEEYRIVLDKNSVSEGKVIFNVTNQGKRKHNFQICLQTTLSVATAECLIGNATKVLAPKESATLNAQLTLGIHLYQSTVAGDAKKGMKGGLDVQPYVEKIEQPPLIPEDDCKNPVATTVQVTAIDFDLRLSQNTIPCGTVTFIITNDSEVTRHNFSIAVGNDRRASETIEPGGHTTTLKVELGPGPHNYRSDGPVDAPAGMIGTLLVTG